MTKLQKLEDALAKTQQKLDALKAELQAERSKAAGSVEVTKNGETFSLSFGGRTLKVTKNTRGRFAVKENGKTLDGDYMGTMADLRVQFALGKI